MIDWNLIEAWAAKGLIASRILRAIFTARERRMLKELTSMIKRQESLNLKPYQCPAGKLTIGFGRNIEDNGISLKEAEYLLSNDIMRCFDEAGQFSFFSGLNDVRQMAIISMLFNLGLPRFLSFKRFIAALELKEYDSASSELLNSLWASQVGRRAVELSGMIKNGTLS